MPSRSSSAAHQLGGERREQQPLAARADRRQQRVGVARDQHQRRLTGWLLERLEQRVLRLRRSGAPPGRRCATLCVPRTGRIARAEVTRADLLDRDDARRRAARPARVARSSTKTSGCEPAATRRHSTQEPQPTPGRAVQSTARREGEGGRALADSGAARRTEGVREAVGVDRTPQQRRARASWPSISSSVTRRLRARARASVGELARQLGDLETGVEHTTRPGAGRRDGAGSRRAPGGGSRAPRARGDPSDRWRARARGRRRGQVEQERQVRRDAAAREGVEAAHASRAGGRDRSSGRRWSSPRSGRRCTIAPRASAGGSGGATCSARSAR